MNNILSIKTPCHETWSGMNVSEAGRFCLSCQKNVHDFENASAEEIRKVYDENDGKICGRIPVRILQQQYEDAQLRKFHGSNIRRFFFAALFCFGASLFTIDAAKASTVYKLKMSFMQTLPENDSIIVKGTVKDRNGKDPIAFAVVRVFHGEKMIGKATTDGMGNYSIKIGNQYKKVDVVASYIGFKDESVKGIVVTPGKRTVVNIGMRYEQEVLMGDVEYIPEPKE